MRFILDIIKRIVGFLAVLVTLGLSLLPLSALLLAYPAFVPTETVLSEAGSPRGLALRRRISALVTGLIVLIVLLAAAVEATTRLPLPAKGQFGGVAKGMLAAADPLAMKLVGMPLTEALPPALVQHWPIVLLIMYLLDILILIFIGKVPLGYNIRNAIVRWKITGLTVLAFTFVIGLLVFMLGFVNGMNNLTQNTGVPGNVFALSEGSTDELFSNLGYGDVDNVERVVCELDEQDRVLKDPVRVKYAEINGKKQALASKETYYVVNQMIPNTKRKRFVQMRTLEDPDVAAAVHNIVLKPGGQWFSRIGVDNSSRIQVVVGEGLAETIGADYGKASLEPGDAFEFAGMTWVVTGIMKSEGTTYGSELWAYRFPRIYEPLGKSKYTTLVLRTEQNTIESSRALAWHLTKRYTQQKLKALAEPDYYAELTKTNNQFLGAIIALAVIMSIGGVFGMMTTMFASIAQRIRDIGVLRLLGFKRWQVLVSFMLESLVVALVGGGLGVLLGYLIGDGKSATSTLSGGGGGGGKNFAVKIDIDPQIVAAGILLTLVMGRVGGLVPSLSAMRAKILDSLR